MKLVAPTLIIASLHFIITLLLGFATGIGTLKGGWVGLINVLTFPMSVFNPPNNPEWLGWVGWISTSLVWGFASAYCVKRFLK